MEYFFILIVLALIWLHFIPEMMLFSGSEYPGKNDKLVWGIACIFLFFITPIAFYCLKKAYLSYCEQERQEMT